MKRRIKNILFSAAIITCTNPGFAQTHIIDSLKQVLKTEKEDTNKVNTLNKLADFLRNSSALDSALRYNNEAQALAEKLGYEKGIAGALDNFGSIYSEKSIYNKAFDYYFKALDFNQQIGNKYGEATVLNNLGNTYLSLGNNLKALDCYVKALPINQEINNKRGITSNLGNIGIVYQSQGNYVKALEYHQKSLAISEEIGDKHATANHFSNMGYTYSMMGNHLKAQECLRKAIEINTETGRTNGVAHNISYIGDDYLAQRNNDSALAYYFKSLSIYQKLLVDKLDVAALRGSIGKVYYKMGKYTLAKEYISNSLQESKKLGDMENIGVDYEILARIDSVKKNYQSEVENYKLSVDYRDSENNEKVFQTEMTYEYNKKADSAKEVQSKKDAAVKAYKRRQQNITRSILGGLLLVIIFSAFIFRSLRVTRKQKNLIGKQKAEVEEQKTLIEEKNKDILDSINYAKRLQDAILPPMSLVKQLFPESFVLYKPKDIVAGDFYWMERVPLNPPEKGTKASGVPPLEGGEAILIAAADCTGHGVPGAMVSVVCSNALNRTVKEFRITEPGKILDKVRELVLETFEKSEDNVQDGMDISLCCINTKTREMQWSGAYNSLWYIQNSQIHEIPADKQPIGKIDNPKPFNTNYLHLQKGDTLYLFTDGYADQFGGPKGKKFKYKQLENFLLANAGKTMNEQKEMLEKTLKDWQGNNEQVDDVLIIGIRV